MPKRMEQNDEKSKPDPPADFTAPESPKTTRISILDAGSVNLGSVDFVQLVVMGGVPYPDGALEGGIVPPGVKSASPEPLRSLFGLEHPEKPLGQHGNALFYRISWI